MMWVIEKYLKFLVLFALLWGTILGTVNFGCRKVHGRQMNPTYRDSDFLFVHRGPHEASDLDHGQVIVYDYQVPGTNDTQFVGRVIGKPGDRIRMEQGKLFRNGAAVGEPYVTEGQTGKDELEEFTVPRGHLYVLNDNRGGAPVSRTDGPLPLACVVGKVHR